jgi:hypothetical protein
MYFPTIKITNKDRKWYSLNTPCREYCSSYLRPTGAPGSSEQYNVGMVGTHGLETSHADTFSSSISREGTLMIREVSWCNNYEEEDS